MSRIVVAHDSEAIREAALRVVREAGYQAIGVAEGESAHVLLMARPHPAALVVDVGLPKRLGYELIDDIRAHKLSTRVILVASVYSKTAYKRKPTSLYGADDYVEQHHIPDQLPIKLARLVPPPRQLSKRDVHRPGTLSDEELRELLQIKAAGEGRLAFIYGSREDGLHRARRLARLIVADVVLYNGQAVAEGLRHGDLTARIARDLEAGRELFAARVPGEIASDHDFIGAALSEFLASRAHED